MRRASEVIQDLAYRSVARARRTLGIQRAASSQRLEIAFVVPLADEARNYVRRLQVDILRRHGVNEGLTATPHITLKLGFKTAELDAFEGYLDEIARATAPLEVRLSKISYFDEGIIFVDVEPNPPLDRLRRTIVRDLADRFAVPPRPLEGDQFRFHATLAYGLPKKRFHQEYERLSRLAPSLRFEARSLAMLCHTGEHWITYRRAALSGS
jgi:2'-5' RNA ligase